MARRPRCSAATAENLFPYIWAAHRLHEDDSQTKLLVEARILARQTSGEIAQLTGVPADVVDAYEALFFHCRPFLSARDWVMVQAIGKWVYGQAEPKAAVILRSFAYHGGPLVLDAVLPYLVGGKDLFDPPLDLSTSAGRREQVIRLAVAVHLLPNDAATNKKLSRIMLILFERGRLTRNRALLPALLTQKLDSRVKEALLDAALERDNQRETACVSGLAAGSRQTA